MVRTIIVLLLGIIPVWAPWMDTTSSGALAERVFEAFGPQPSSCYDSKGVELHNGLDVRWYPMGRLVHTCAGDYIVWFWGAVKEAGGVYKSARDIQPVRSRPLTCKDVLDRTAAHEASSTEPLLVYTGITATSVDYALFPDAKNHAVILNDTLRKGPNFAGKFAVAEWQCGSGCRNFAILDVETGRVISVGPQTEYGVLYSLDSTLLVTNPLTALPPTPDSGYETETMALDIARLPREYYRLTTDKLSKTQYLVRECVESSASGYIEMQDDHLDIISTTQ